MASVRPSSSSCFPLNEGGGRRKLALNNRPVQGLAEISVAGINSKHFAIVGPAVAGSTCPATRCGKDAIGRCSRWYFDMNDAGLHFGTMSRMYGKEIPQAAGSGGVMACREVKGGVQEL